MTFIEFFKQQFIEEGATTRKMLSRVPDDNLDYKPHEKSMVMKSLVTHLADLPGWVHFTLTTDELFSISCNVNLQGRSRSNTGNSGGDR